MSAGTQRSTHATSTMPRGIGRLLTLAACCGWLLRAQPRSGNHRWTPRDEFHLSKQMRRQDARSTLSADSQADTGALARYASRRMSPPLRNLLIVLCLLCAIGVTLRVGSKHSRSPAPDPADPSGRISQKQVDQFLSLEATEAELNKTVWAKEILAEHCCQVFDAFWDSLNAATNKLEVAASFALGELTLGDFNSTQRLAHGIELRASSGAGPTWSASDWQRFVRESQAAGWQCERLEFRHNQFATDDSGRPRRSRFYFSAHLTNPALVKRASLEGDLVVDWAPKPPELPAVKRIDASRLILKMRTGEPPFQPILVEAVTPPEESYFIDPLILYDLDGDGLSEIILAAKNLVFHRKPDGKYESTPLCRHSPGLIFTGVIADFDGDGAADFLCAKFEGLVLFKGSARGTFDEPGRLVWSAEPHLKYGQVLTCGDIDGDGDLDVFLAQYKVPYTRGQMPTPFYDANDGYPAYLLQNDGRGNFKDVTEAAGLGKKRWRRTYSASLVDLDRDGRPELMVVSDFCGTDLYHNDGHGHFTDVTERWLDEPRAAGMAHAVADFDADGFPDLLVIGMHSPTVDRLAHLSLVRPGFPDAADRSVWLMHGNRLYFGQRGGGFRQGALSASIARSGWSWGCGAADFDNDGFPDVYIANGHETKQSVRDYETEFWLHDVYVSSSKEDNVLAGYFSAKMARTRGQGWSYGGYENNRFYLNQRGESFVEVAHLLGLAIGEDSRDVAADDLDGDGRPDLLVTTFEAWPQAKQTLRVFRNGIDESGNWVGFRFREEGGGKSPVNAQVTLRYAGRSAVRQIINGDSYRTQSANTVCFGLGKTTEVDDVEIRWADGRKLELRQPGINQYHSVASQTSAPGR